MAIRAVFVDVDGTLLTSALTLSPRVLRAVDECVENGVAVVLSSGRSLKSLRSLAGQFGHEPQFIIASNGGIVADEVAGESWTTGTLGSIAIERIVDVAREHALGLCTYTRAGWIASGNANWVALEVDRSGAGPDQECELSELGSLVGESACKVLLIGEPQTVARLRPDLALELVGGESVYMTYPEFLEISAPGATKVHAIRDVLSRLSLRTEDIAAIGDGENDLPMLEMAGVAVAVANATPAVLAAAHVVVPSHDEDGVAIAIEGLVFNRPEAAARLHHDVR